jgi:hypothetical protein
MRAEFHQRTERVLRLTKTDSMGRTPEQIEAMEQNELKPPKLSEATRAVHAICADEHREYPKALYRLALRKGVPAGDEVAPNFPMPYDLALQCGEADKGFRVINKTATSPGNVILRYAWVTRLVGEIKDDLSVDVAAARAEEAELRKKGWVSSPSEIKGLPTPSVEAPYDPLPDEVLEVKANGNGRGK